MGIEEDMEGMFKFFKVGKDGKGGLPLNALIRSAQLAVLVKLKGEIDKMISNVSKMPDGTDQNIPDPFQILGVEPTASKDEVDKAYRSKAKEAHPDKGGSDEQMILVNAAYEAIRRVKGWK